MYLCAFVSEDRLTCLSGRLTSLINCCVYPSAIKVFELSFQKSRGFLGGVEPFAFFSASSADVFQTVITSLVFSLTRVHPPCLKR